MNITSGKQEYKKIIALYGPEGIGKTSFAAQFFKALFIDCESGSLDLDVARLPKPTSYPHLLSMIESLNVTGVEYKTLVIDTIDVVERLIIEDICAKKNKQSIEDFGYGKGYTHVAEELGRFLNKLTDLREKGWTIVVCAHSILRKFEQPDEAGAYDRYELNLSRKAAPMIKEWCDMLLFANYKTTVVEIDGRKKATGGKRVMYASHSPSWDAKNRCGLPDELPFDYESIKHVIEKGNDKFNDKFVESVIPEKESVTSFPSQLWDLMTMHGVTDDDIRSVVAAKGYYPIETHPSDYDDAFVQGVLIGAWDKVYALIKAKKENEK